MEELTQRIMLKAYQISTQTKADVFIYYAGHVNKFEIFFYRDGWKKDIDWDFKLETYLDNEKEAIIKLQLILKELEKLEGK